MKKRKKKIKNDVINNLLINYNLIYIEYSHFKIFIMKLNLICLYKFIKENYINENLFINIRFIDFY